MTFINMAVVEAAQPLKSAHYRFPRAELLRRMLSECLTDYYLKASIGQPFEARGLLVTGKSRVGKTRELERMITEFNETKTAMPNGKPASIVQSRLSGKVTSSKDLAVKALKALGYPSMPRATENEMWERVHQQAAHLGVIGIHFDEAQHAFTESGHAANGVVLNILKKILKDMSCPMILILSGVPVLGEHIEMEERGEDRLQLRYLLKAIHFDLINFKRDREALIKLVFTYAKKANIDFQPLCDPKFFHRLGHAAGYRWGIVIELLIAALTACLVEKEKEISIKHFEQAFNEVYGMTTGFTPFTLPDFLHAFDAEKLIDQLDRKH
ncbi:ATP-binding protein [Falsigemmobacter intermedius]|uniref:ATP-binding protein n=1 Tax=Falsigemmobacter intermedius TaxID=1553448 RepID=A0A451GHR2_9RHOB|nr:ATP-binding protein [Falsigemmobacter intermedius]RWY38501.1 ATP-binding protein [Falsigemmobacter intermedius]